MALHTVTPAVGMMCRYKTKVGLRRLPRDLHTRTRLSSLPRLNLDSSLNTTWFHSAAVQFPSTWHHSKRRHRWVGVKGGTRNGLFLCKRFSTLKQVLVTCFLLHGERR
ncbi:uncharacterized protein TNCV_1630441 [Trichonephila clavipes]|uniref:Uncharacterized protein n=1 Tax=Trichonephila clavipes TaxID=2585209 RepID=A0A8X7BAJ2_TRICX|nr:uncharacterized protein TNCV_1630441 [Trichonephila clavipes]